MPSPPVLRWYFAALGALVLAPSAALLAQAGSPRSTTEVPPAAGELQYFPAEALRNLLSAEARSGRRGPARRVGAQPGYEYVAVRRDRTGDAEVHATLDDVMFIREGGATLAYGGRLADPRQAKPGEFRGKEIIGGRTQVVSSGDMVVVPAGTPHQMQVSPGASISYVMLKIPRPAAARAPSDSAPRKP